MDDKVRESGRETHTQRKRGTERERERDTHTQNNKKRVRGRQRDEKVGEV